MFFHQYFKGT